MTETTGFHASVAPADVVRRQYLASANGDLEALRATLADDVEWTEMAGFPLAGTYCTTSSAAVAASSASNSSSTPRRSVTQCRPSRSGSRSPVV
jgi:ketosteroid isomerase-like protein